MSSILANSLIETSDIDYDMPFSDSICLQEEEIGFPKWVDPSNQIRYPFINLLYSSNDIDDISASSNVSVTPISKSETYDSVIVGKVIEDFENIIIVNMTPIRSFNITLKIEDIKEAKPNVIKTEL